MVVVPMEKLVATTMVRLHVLSLAPPILLPPFLRLVEMDMDKLHASSQLIASLHLRLTCLQLAVVVMNTGKPPVPSQLTAALFQLQLTLAP